MLMPTVCNPQLKASVRVAVYAYRHYLRQKAGGKVYLSFMSFGTGLSLLYDDLHDISK